MQIVNTCGLSSIKDLTQQQQLQQGGDASLSTPFVSPPPPWWNLSSPPLVHPHIYVLYAIAHCTAPHMLVQLHTQGSVCAHTINAQFSCTRAPSAWPPYLPTPSDALLGTPLTGGRLNAGFASNFTHPAYKANTNVKLALMVFKYLFVMMSAWKDFK